MERSTTTPDQHIASLPDDVRGDIEALDRLITEALPGASRTLWEGRFWGGIDQRIIGYGDLVYERPNKPTVEWFIIGLAAQKNHLSLYASASDQGGYLVGRYADKLGKVKVGSAAVTFRSAADLDLVAVRELVVEAHQAASRTD